jgi:hypothetical protein
MDVSSHGGLLMLKFLTSQMRRSVVFSAAFCLLLVLAGTLFSIGAGLLISAVGHTDYDQLHVG